MAKYEIIIRADGGGQADSSGGGVVAQPSRQSSGNEDNQTALTLKSLRAFAKKSIVVGTAISTFKWQASLVGRNTGNSDIQQKIDAHMSIAGQAGTIVAGFAFAGPLGGLAAVVGVGLSYAKEIEANQYAKTWENIALGQSRYRAGPSLNRSRT